MNNNFGNFLQTPHSTGSIKYLYTDTKNLFMSNWILGFQNGYNQAELGLHVMQFWSENILVISNQGDAVFDFKVSQYDFTSNCTPINSIPIINQTFLGPIITVISAHTSNPAATTALSIVKWNGIRKWHHSVSFCKNEFFIRFQTPILDFFLCNAL